MAISCQHIIWQGINASFAVPRSRGYGIIIHRNNEVDPKSRAILAFNFLLCFLPILCLFFLNHALTHCLIFWVHYTCSEISICMEGLGKSIAWPIVSWVYNNNRHHYFLRSIFHAYLYRGVLIILSALFVYGWKRCKYFRQNYKGCR